MRKKQEVKNDARVVHDVLEIVKKQAAVTAATNPKSFNRMSANLQELHSRKKSLHVKNFFSFVFAEKSSDVLKTKEKVVRNCNIAQIIIRQNKERMQDNIASKIKNNSSVLVHGLNQEITNALLQSVQQGKKCKVFLTQSPFSASRNVFVKKLMQNDIVVEWFSAAAARQVLKNSDLVMLCADAVTPEKVVSAMGGELFAELAAKRGVPVFAVAFSYMFHHDVNMNSLRGNMQVFGAKHVFEKVQPSLITGIISEKGVHSHAVFVDVVRCMQEKGLFI